MKKNTLENLFVIFGFLFFSGGLQVFNLPSLFISVFRYLTPLICIGLITQKLGTFISLFKRDVFLSSVIVLSLFSFLWSDVPSNTIFLIRGQLLPMTCFGLYLATYFDTDKLLRKITYACLVGILLSWFVVVAMPSVGITQGGKFAGSWLGIYGPQKNTASAYMVVTALMLLISSFQRDQQKYFGISYHVILRISGVSALIFILLTASGTGLAITVVISLTLFLYPNFRWKGKISVLVCQMIVMMYLFISVSWESIVIAMGKDPTLTGRTTFWEIATDAVQAHKPILGFGRGGFWISSHIVLIANRMGGYIPPHAHNGFVEVFLDLGNLGYYLLLASFAITWYRVLKQAYQTRKAADFMPLSFMVFYTINNITESYTLYLTNIFWPLYIAISLNANRSELRKCLEKRSERRESELRIKASLSS